MKEGQHINRVYRVELNNEIVEYFSKESDWKTNIMRIREQYKGQGWIAIYFKTGKTIQYGFYV